MGGEREFDSISQTEVRAFLDGNLPLSHYWHRKHSALMRFFRFALARGLASAIPLPARTPRCYHDYQPYVYFEDDVDRLITALDGVRATPIEARTLRALILLLYGTGLRRGEALHLCLADVDLPRQLLTVRDTRFYKTRWVPVGTHLVQILHEYIVAVHTPHSFEAPDDTPLFVRRDGGWPTASGIRRAFARLRSKAGVRRNDGARYQPRLHDMRATFAVHRLTTWYQQGADVQRLLPLLSTYLGHASIAATQVYLPMSPELLVEASSRFGRYVALEKRS
ncbi:MAG: Integrase/recombinase, RitB [uncultured Paraburkholderia sp.]|nr:MAG: Integrase/recombinase, RitB [uncultured Paraburkholderia sp.]CAH2941148.1 MAG: Integrase/recombinase, RitB [uncultured Paraburkholderia sp.]